MNEIRAFFTLPEYSNYSPNTINLVGNVCLASAIYLTRSSIVVSQLDDLNNSYVYQLKPFNKITVLGVALSVLLFIPGLILGILFKGLSYIDPAVRTQHKLFRGLHEQAHKKSHEKIEHASS